MLCGIGVFLPSEYENGDAGSSSPGLRFIGMFYYGQTTDDG